MRIFRRNFAKFSRGHAPGPPRMVVPSALPPKLICDITRLWRHTTVTKLAPPRKFSAYATGHGTELGCTYCRTVARFQGLGGNTFLGGKNFCFISYFNKKFSEHNKVGGAQKAFGWALLQNVSPWLRAWLTVYAGYVETKHFSAIFVSFSNVFLFLWLRFKGLTSFNRIFGLGY